MTEPTTSDDLRKTIAKRMRDNGITQWHLADASGISQSQISRFLNGESSLSLKRLDTIIRLLGGGSWSWSFVRSSSIHDNLNRAVAERKDMAERQALAERLRSAAEQITEQIKTISFDELDEDELNELES